MSIRRRRADQGADDARRLAQRLGAELRDARLGLGVSERFVAREAGISQSQLGRLERAETRDLSLGQVARVGRILCLRLSARLYPEGSPVRDAGHLRLLARLEELLGSPLRVRREVPLPMDEDRRAWDAVIEGHGDRACTEAETHLLDIQAVTRRVLLKQRDDDRAGVVILVVARTRHNLAVLREHREAMRADFPLDGVSIARALRAGRLPGASGILVL